MKKAIRLTATLAVLSLAISVFSACNSPLSNDATTDSNPDQTIVTTNTDNTSTEITDESKPTSTTTTTNKVETDSIETILNLIVNYPMGTAGSAQKCVDISIKLINFTENNTADSKKLNKEIESFRSSLDDKHKALFEQNLYEIDYTARKLIKGETSSYQSNIDESKEKFSKGKYTLTKYEDVYKLIANS